MSESFSDNLERNRFELDVGGTIVFANYQRMRDRVAVTHVEAPIALRGTGAASRLMQHIVEVMRAEGLPIIPICTYAAHWMKRNETA